LLQAADGESRRKPRNKHGALLYGLLHCSRCSKPMAHTSTQRDGRQYRYYVCRSKDCIRACVNATAFEASVVEQMESVAPRSLRGDVPRRIAALVDRVLYDGQENEVSIQMRASKERRRG